jgi:hypothetical protein
MLLVTPRGAEFAGERVHEPLVLPRAWALIIVTRTEEAD